MSLLRPPKLSSSILSNTSKDWLREISLPFSSEKHGVDILFKLLLLQLIQTFPLLRKSFGRTFLQVRSVNDLAVDIGQYYPRLMVASTGRGNNRHTG